MPIGPGLYDRYAKLVILETGASIAVVIVMGGRDGSGFSVNTINPSLVIGLPAMLRNLADKVEEENLKTYQ